MFGLFETVFEYAFWGTLAAGGIAVAAIPVALPQARLLPRTVRAVIVCAGVGVGAFALGHVHGMEERGPTVAQLQREVAAARERAMEQSKLAQVRLTALAETLTQLDAYEEELANGQTTACPSDTAYDRRLRNILGGATQ